MKSVTEAMALRNHILTKFEEALTADDATKRQRLLNLVVVGGGATGVEISGALAEISTPVAPSSSTTRLSNRCRFRGMPAVRASCSSDIVLNAMASVTLFIGKA